mgnify:CR=1 FL=1|jgi:hypothetical protein
MQRPFDSRPFRFTGALLSLCFAFTGCSLFSGGLKIHTSARGSVVIEEVADWSFEASHPAIIDQLTLIKAMKGVMAEDVPDKSMKMPVSGSKPMRLFSDEDAEFLAPLLAQGLSQAKPEQIVGFTVSSSAGSGAEPTAGTLYVQQGALHFTVVAPRSKKVTMFVPNSAARIEKAPSYAAAGLPGVMSLVIDYAALAKATMPAAIPVAAAPKPIPAPSSVPPAPTVKPIPMQDPPTLIQAVTVSTPAPAESGSVALSNDELLSKKLDELRQTREANKMKDSEIAMLKKELAWMKQELRERTEEMKAIKANKASTRQTQKKRTAEAQSFR